MASNAPAPVTKYFWLVTFQWPVRNGFQTATFTNTFDVPNPVSRAELLAEIRQGVGEHGVPENANVLFLSIEPDRIPGPVA